MKLEVLKAFSVLGRTLSFRRTAELMYISQSALTRQIENLEAEWKVKLFTRSTRSVSLTKEGEALLADVEALLAAEERLVKHVGQLSGAGRGNITIGYIERPSMLLIGQMMTAFRHVCPQVRIYIVTGTIERLLEQFRRGELDCLLLLRPCMNSLKNCEVITIEPQEMSVLAPVGHRLENLPSISLDLLKGETLIIHSKEKSRDVQETLLDFCHRSGYRPERVIEADETMGNYVANGRGIGLLPVYERDFELMFPGTKIIRVENSAGIFDRVLAYRTQHMDRELALFVDTVKEFARRHSKLLQKPK